MASLKERGEDVTPHKARPTRKKHSRHSFTLPRLTQTV
jgi:uncharacterized protein YnzC (UPF0291/DUF896 family)